MRSLAILVLVLLTVGSIPSLGHSQTKSLYIGIDGLGYGLQGFDVANTPVMDSLIDGTWRPEYNGAYTDQSFAGGVLGTTTQQVTVSGPGWSTIMTGVWTDRHGVNGNGSTFSSGNFAANPPYLATLREHDPSIVTASFVNWDPIDTNIVGSIDADGDAANDVGFRGTYNSDQQVATGAAAQITGSLDPDAVFVAFDEVDGAGHSCGSSGSCYRQEIEEVDDLVGLLLFAVTSRPNFANEDWQIVVTSDHGHTPAGGHGGQTELERRIPLIVASKTLNQGTLPSIFQDVSQADGAPTILDHFDVPLPSHYWGMSRASGAVTIDPDINGDGIVSGDGTGPYAADDVTAFVSHWLQPSTATDLNPADFNLDGIADLYDWAILNNELPHMGALVANALVPEPNPIAHGVPLILAMLLLRRRR